MAFGMPVFLIHGDIVMVISLQILNATYWNSQLYK